MKKVERNEIIDFVTYGERRNDIRGLALQAKKLRRIHLGEHLTFLFENTETIRYQIQEMVRVEKLVREEAIHHEIETYNELLGEPGELGCTLLIEFDNPEEREQQLVKLRDLPQHLYLLMENEERAPAIFDERQMNDEKVSSVQFLKFKCPSPPVSIGCSHPEYKMEDDIPMEQRQVLKADLV